MCGICGFLHPPRDKDWIEASCRKMTRELVHRGPDSEGLWTDPEVGVALGHRRLSILDLSEHGSQPMTSPSGRYVIAYNGEIYNHLDARPELEREGIGFRGHSDTETILAAIDAHGLQTALQGFNGMFAFALWDREERTLTLARDRMGIKPLYYGWLDDNRFVFGSTPRAIRRAPGFSPQINIEALALYLRHNYIPAPYSIYRGIAKLPPGNLLRVATPRRSETMEPRPYWSLDRVAAQGLANPFRGDEREATDALHDLLQDAVNLRLISDVPIGAFLSGGIDSSTVTALMQQSAGKPVRTFSIGFTEPAYNEARHARAVADHLHTDHTELYVTPDEAMEVIPEISGIYDEPFADSSQIPTYLVSRLARRDVTVALSGDGGDELFFGYHRYPRARSFWRWFRRTPGGVRRTLASVIESFSPEFWNRTASWLGPLAARHGRSGPIGDKFYKAVPLLRLSGPDDLYRFLVSAWKFPDRLLDGVAEPETVFARANESFPALDFEQRMMAIDQLSYLPDDILAKVDRASMAVGLEARVPILDHRVIEFAWRLPHRFKERDGNQKWLLRQVLERYVPAKMVDRPKMGFGVPIGVWLRGPLRDWAENLLDERRLTGQGIMNVKTIRDCWSQHLAGTHNWETRLWIVLMFQAWLDDAEPGV